MFGQQRLDTVSAETAAMHVREQGRRTVSGRFFDPRLQNVASTKALRKPSPLWAVAVLPLEYAAASLAPELAATSPPAWPPAMPFRREPPSRKRRLRNAIEADREKVEQIHLQRVVGAFVGSPYGAGRQAGSRGCGFAIRLANDNRDEERGGLPASRTRLPLCALRRDGPSGLRPAGRRRRRPPPPATTSPARIGSPTKRPDPAAATGDFPIEPALSPAATGARDQIASLLAGTKGGNQSLLCVRATRHAAPNTPWPSAARNSPGGPLFPGTMSRRGYCAFYLDCLFCLPEEGR
jgi:hypothetical protein